MKGLLIKDFRILKSQLYMLLIALGCTLIFIAGDDKTFGAAYACVMGGILSIMTLSYDEYNNGYSFLFTLPVTRKKYVIEKYVFALILLVISILLVGSMIGIWNLIQGSGIKMEGFTESLVGGITAWALMTGMAFPSQLKFGMAKGRVALVIIFAVLFGCAFVIGELPALHGLRNYLWMGAGRMDRMGTIGIMGIFAVGWMIVIVVSVTVSIRIIEKKEF